MIIQKQKKFSGKIIFTAVADEETGGEGAKEVIKHGYKPDFVVVGEPTDLRICVGNKGRGEIKVEVTGKSCHASIPDKGINAIEIGSKIAYHISKYKDGYGEENKYFGKSRGSITMIEGGLAPNIIPDIFPLSFVNNSAINEFSLYLVLLIKNPSSDQFIFYLYFLNIL